MHEESGGRGHRGPWRKEAKKAKDRKVLGDCDDGDRFELVGPAPVVRIGGEWVVAPSRSGMISHFAQGGVSISLRMPDGKWVGPMEARMDEAIELKGTHSP